MLAYTGTIALFVKLKQIIVNIIPYIKNSLDDNLL